MFNFLKKYKSENFKAVYDNDLAPYLESLGVLDGLEKYEKRCQFCGDILKIENVGAISPKNGEIEIICNKTKCLNQL